MQGIGVVKDSLPPVPEDKELRAKNRARNEELKKAKEDKKAKSARKAQRREISAKNQREAEKAGLPPPDSPETSVSEVEGGGDNAHGLDELEAEEDDVIPPVGGGIEILKGSKAREGSEAPEGSQAPGGGQTVPHLIVDDEDGASREGSIPLGPQEGERVPGGESDAPPPPVVSKGSTEPTLRPGRRWEVRLKRHGPKPPSQPLRQLLRRWGSARRPLVLAWALRGLRAPRRALLPGQGMCNLSDLSFGFLFFSFISTGVILSISRKHKVASVELAPRNAVNRGAQSTPGRARPKSPPALSHEEGDLPRDEGGQETRKTPDPSAKEMGTPRLHESEETVLGLGAVPTSGGQPRGSGST